MGRSFGRYDGHPQKVFGEWKVCGRFKKQKRGLVLTVQRKWFAVIRKSSIHTTHPVHPPCLPEDTGCVFPELYQVLNHHGMFLGCFYWICSVYILELPEKS